MTDPNPIESPDDRKRRLNRERVARYRSNNPDKVKEQNDAQKANKQQWEEENRSKRRKSVSEYQKRNPEKASEKQKRYRKRKNEQEQ